MGLKRHFDILERHTDFDCHNFLSSGKYGPPYFIQIILYIFISCAMHFLQEVKEDSHVDYAPIVMR